jgi:NhaP-type Na+/H+ or K+/H+ antiporter
MFARLTAKAVLATIALAMAFFGIGLLGLALVSALTKALGPIGGYALAGALLLLPPLIWALVTHLSRPKKAPPQASGNELTKVLLAAVAKETPWVAIVGAGIAGAANMFLNRNKSSK